ncbi:hypothetical protein DFH05DRAFT_1535542 [Lentinula detonsa]|uniref:Uncharacterized protein n=1 Tax=Lentinula detonsa TaxID=2804962 RepID=A0A9W8P0K2_9AGAR|nr:hypothetical protein DFH05DRAFT_1535542 [Lentinula detonsa]
MSRLSHVIRDELKGADVLGPFANGEEWELAKWSIKNVGHNATESFLKLPIIKRRVDPDFKTKDQFLDRIDELPSGVEWQRRVLSLIGDLKDEDGNPLTEDLKLWFRDPVECVHELMGNPVFRKVMKYSPVKLFNDAEERSESIDEMWTAQWWWELQKVLPPGATISPIILSSDKTKLSQFKGDKTAWPVYLTIGNIAKDVRRQASYLPVGKFNCFSEKMRSVARYRTFHQCMTMLTSSLVEPGQKGITMTCADSFVRRVFPILAAYCLVACCMENQCPICNHEDAGIRTHTETELLLDRNKDGWRDVEFEALGIHPVHEPFWSKLPYSNIFQSFTPDLLHQLHKGVFKDHLVKWITEIIGTKELDERYKSMTNDSDIRHFKNGISSVSQWTGAEYKAMQKVFVGLIAGSVSDNVMICVRAALDFIYYSSLHCHSTDTLTALQNALNDFHAHKQIFIDLEARKATHFNIPKLHAMKHYVALIRHFGSADGFNTESPERLHIDYAKNAYRASNKKDYVIQMTRWLQRQEAVDRFTLFLDWTENGEYKADGASEHGMGRELMDDTGDITVAVTSIDLDVDITSLLRNVSAAKIIQQHQTSYFLEALDVFLTAHGGVIKPLAHNGFDLFKTITLTLPRISFASCTSDRLKNIIRASPPVLPTPNPQKSGESAHMDFALISTNERNESTEGTALEGLRVALVCVLFKLPAVYRVQVAHPLAYIEWYTPFSNPNPHSGLYTLKPSKRNRHPCGEIIPVTRIVRNAHLIPYFGCEKDRSWTSENVREKCKVFSFNPYRDLHIFTQFKGGHAHFKIK